MIDVADHAARRSCAIFDTSDAAKLLLTGPDAPRLVHNISTNEIAELPLGAGCETYFLDARAKTLFVAWVYHLLADGEHALWLETTPGRGSDLAAHLDRFIISEQVEIADVSATFAQFHVAGPTAHATLETALSDTLPALPEFAHLERTFGSQSTAHIRARSLLGVPSYDVVCRSERAAGIRRMLEAAGATPADADAFEVLRIDAGTPRFGPDFDATRFVMEFAHPRAISYTKGCFPGQEPIVMSRDRAGRVNRQFVRLRADAPVEVGCRLSAAGQEVGFVTSAAGKIALGYVRWDHAAPGTSLDAQGVGVKVAS